MKSFCFFKTFWIGNFFFFQARTMINKRFSIVTQRCKLEYRFFRSSWWILKANYLVDKNTSLFLPIAENLMRHFRGKSRVVVFEILLLTNQFKFQCIVAIDNVRLQTRCSRIIHHAWGIWFYSTTREIIYRIDRKGKTFFLVRWLTVFRLLSLTERPWYCKTGGEVMCEMSKCASDSESLLFRWNS